MGYGKYYLDLGKVAKIRDTEEMERIHGYYKEFLFSLLEDTSARTESLFNTLRMAGYLLDSEQVNRDKKLDEVLDGDKG